MRQRRAAQRDRDGDHKPGRDVPGRDRRGRRADSVQYPGLQRRDRGGRQEDTASVQVNATGQWITIYSETDVSAAEWTTESFDISSIVQGATNNNFRVLFQLTSDGAENDSGWNIDAFEVRSDTCEPFERASAGEVGGLTVERGGPG